MAKLIRWLDEHFEEYILCDLLAIIATIMILGVIMRYVFNSSLTWVEELCRFAFIWSAFLSIGYSIKEKSILTLTFFVEILPRPLSIVVKLLGKIVVVVFFVYIFVHSIPMVEKIYLVNQKSPALGIPMYFIYLSIVVGSFLAILRSIQDIIIMEKGFCK